MELHSETLKSQADAVAAEKICIFAVFLGCGSLAVLALGVPVWGINRGLKPGQRE